MSFIWAFFLAHWLLIFWGWIAFAVLVASLWAAINEIAFRVTRRRYQASSER